MKLALSFCVLLLFLLSTTDSYSQRIIKVESKYSHAQELYDFQDMENVFISNFDSYLEFQSAVKARTNSRFLGYTTLAAMGVGTLAPIIDPNDGCGGSFCITAGQIVGLLSWLVVVPVVGTIGIITRLKYNSKKKKAISLFNDAQDIGHLVDPPGWNLRIGGGRYGVGLIINF